MVKLIEKAKNLFINTENRLKSLQIQKELAEYEREKTNRNIIYIWTTKDEETMQLLRGYLKLYKADIEAATKKGVKSDG